MYRAIEYRIQELKHVEQMKAEATTPPVGSPSTQEEEAEDDEEKSEETTEQLHSKTIEDNEGESKTGELPSSTKTEEDGALQSTKTKGRLILQFLITSLHLPKSQI